MPEEERGFGERNSFLLGSSVENMGSINGKGKFLEKSPGVTRGVGKREMGERHCNATHKGNGNLEKGERKGKEERGGGLHTILVSLPHSSLWERGDKIPTRNYGI